MRRRAKVLRLMADEGVEWPLWDERGPVDDPSSLGLSDELIHAIRRWFNEYMSSEMSDLEPSDPRESELKYEAEALRLVDAIQIEVGTLYQVKYVS